MTQDQDKELKDFLLWKSFTKDIEPMRQKNWEEEEMALTRESDKNPSPVIIERVIPEIKEEKSQTQSIFHQLDRKTEEKLRKGKMPIEGTLDLHGLNQSQAYSAVENAILKGSEQGKRCLLVITGKGNTGRTSDHWLMPATGILKTRVPEWLSSPPLSYHVLKYMPAQPKHGGGGALYVYLRRNK